MGVDRVDHQIEHSFRLRFKTFHIISPHIFSNLIARLLALFRFQCQYYTPCDKNLQAFLIGFYEKFVNMKGFDVHVKPEDQP